MLERVAIVGSRDYPDLEEVRAYVATLPAGTVVISGGARGVDKAAEGAARARGLAVVSYRPMKLTDGRWRILQVTQPPFTGQRRAYLAESFPTFPPAAYFRNGLIVDDSDRVEIWWDGRSPGSRNTAELARKAGKLGQVHKPSPTGTPCLPIYPHGRMVGDTFASAVAGTQYTAKGGPLGPSREVSSK